MIKSGDYKKVASLNLSDRVLVGDGYIKYEGNGKLFINYCIL